MKILVSVVTIFLCTFLSISALAETPVAKTESHLAASERLLEVMRVEEMMEKQMGPLKKMMADMMVGGEAVTPKSPAEVKLENEMVTSQANFMDLIQDQMNWPSMKADFIKAYAEVFTENELNQLTEFYKSPIGQKYIDKTPELTLKTMELSQKRVLEIMPKIQEMTEKTFLKSNNLEKSESDDGN